MYTEFFHLDAEPFQLTPDPRFLCLTAGHQDAVNHLVYGIFERKGFVCLTGEVGTGKTTLARALINELPDDVHSAMILNPMLSETQLLRAVAGEYGIDTSGRGRLGLLDRINEFLLHVHAAGELAVLLVDEAQNMHPRTLEMMRLLSNLETETHKLIQIILVGQPELRDKLRRPELRQLAQRITVWYHLQPLSQRDTEEYIRHRLNMAVAGDTEFEPTVRFDRGALKEIYRFSRGTPRLINAVGEKALLAGYVHKTGRINRAMVRRAIQELGETPA